MSIAPYATTIRMPNLPAWIDTCRTFDVKCDECTESSEYAYDGVFAYDSDTGQGDAPTVFLVNRGCIRADNPECDPEDACTATVEKLEEEALYYLGTMH